MFGLHPITQVEIVGIVTYWRDFRDKVILGLDDGTAILRCIFHTNTSSIQGRLGNVLRLFGKIKIYKSQRQISVTKLGLKNML